MIPVTRSSPAPHCLAIEKQKKSGDYKCGDVIERLNADFRNKCYLCELAQPTSINVEHLISHQEDPELKFDWNNLYLACPHCNNTKGYQYDGILDCTDPNNNVLGWIKYKVKPFPKEEVKLIVRKRRKSVHLTIELLQKIYNGTTKLKRTEASNLRSLLLKEMAKFVILVQDFLDNETSEDDKKICLEAIIRRLKPNSSFSAFKYWYIMENNILRNTFSQYIEIEFRDKFSEESFSVAT